MKRARLMLKDTWLILLDVAVLYAALFALVCGAAELARQGTGLGTLAAGVLSVGWVFYASERRRWPR